MAAITAAVIGAAVTVGTTAYTASQSSGGGGSQNPNIKPAPQDPLDKTMRTYYDRLTVANANTRYPSFAEYINSGGDPAKAQMDVKIPDLKPSEAAALGFVGGHGEQIPTVSQAGLASGDITKLTPEQTLYLSQERARAAAASGQKPGPWAARGQRLQNRDERLENRIAALQGMDTRTPQQERKLGRLTTRHGRVESKLSQFAGGATEEDE